MAIRQSSNLVTDGSAVASSDPNKTTTVDKGTTTTSQALPPTMSSQQKLSKELNQLTPEWRSILVGEDLVVAALQKSLRRGGVSISSDAAYQAVRDVIGQLFTLLNDDSLTKKITLVLKGSDGSGDGTKLTPPPNP